VQIAVSGGGVAAHALQLSQLCWVNGLLGLDGSLVNYVIKNM
jgi:hypothetical protein